MMNKKIVFLLLNLLLCCGYIGAQEKSELHQRAEAVDPKQDIAKARSLYIHAFNDYAGNGQTALAVECGVKATPLYYKDGFYKEAFELLRRVDQVIVSGSQPANEKAALHYQVTKERMQMYMRLRKNASVQEQLANMERQARESGNDDVKNDLLYNKAIYYYTFGQNAQGDAVFREMADKLTTSKEYDKVDEVYQTLIENGRRSGNANMVAQSYGSYVVWKDSVTALKHTDEIDALKQQIATHEATIADKDSSLSTRQTIIIGLCILAAILAAVLVLGAIVLMRFIMLTRKQKKTIRLANDSNALKAKFISNISAQLEPTLQKLDSSQPEVKALLDFSSHVQTLSELENSDASTIEMEETQISPFCENLMNQVREKAKSGITLTVNAQKMSAMINKEYVSHILTHLLENAIEYVPEGGTVSLEFKKRGPHTHQFLVSNTGQTIPEEKREDLFKPFLEIRDLTTGDGLGLPICKQMALKMNGDLNVDPQFTKGTRFVLDLHTGKV